MRKKRADAPIPEVTAAFVEVNSNAFCEAIRARARGLDSLSGRDNTASGHQHGLFFGPIGFSLRTVGRLPQNHTNMNNMTSADGFGYDGRVLEIV
jgi:hypothetical protein